MKMHLTLNHKIAMLDYHRSTLEGYKMSVDVVLRTTEFYASELIDAIEALGVDATVYHSGGGCATFEIGNDDVNESVLAGPGSYNWDSPNESIFSTDEFFYGEDAYDCDGDEKNRELDSFVVESETPIKEIAQNIVAYYNILNDL